MIPNKILRNNGLISGRMISHSKSEYRIANPKNVVYFNACIFTPSNGFVWGGDLDLTKDSEVLKKAADEIGEELFIVKESDTFFDEVDFVNKAVWSTSKEVPTK